MFQTPLKVSLIVFLVLILQGSSLGLSDDEAYYWVLSQTPSFGYAFHPPGVAWLIYLSQQLMRLFPEWLFPEVFFVRLPAALLTSLTVLVALDWIKIFHSKIFHAALVILSFVGFFSLSWMVVPDNLLFFALTLLFVTTHRLCREERLLQSKTLFYLFLGALLIPLSKYSGLLAVFSSGTSILFFSDFKCKIKSIFALALGCFIGMTPALVWNYQHNWASLLYQIYDRHVGADLSWIRYVRFWGSQFVLAGPILIGFTFFCTVRGLKIKKVKQTSPFYLDLFSSIWILPPLLIFCIQPLFSDFKIHWAFVAWWPAVLVMAARLTDQASWKWIRLQMSYGLFLSFLILLSCQLPVTRWVHLSLFPRANWDPKWDVTNDFYGWRDLPRWMSSHLSAGDLKLPVVGSRYQTASQAAFVLNKIQRVSFAPRSPKEWDEWPKLAALESLGPEWSSLRSSILYVADNRYDLPPQFTQSRCSSLGRLETTRLSIPAKWIEIWRCAPNDVLLVD